jgi:hypothetical protein
MNDKEFLDRLEIGLSAYQKENIWDFEEDKVLEDFVDWLYKQYGFIRKSNGNT